MFRRLLGVGARCHQGRSWGPNGIMLSHSPPAAHPTAHSDFPSTVFSRVSTAQTERATGMVPMFVSPKHATPHCCGGMIPHPPTTDIGELFRKASRNLLASLAPYSGAPGPRPTVPLSHGVVGAAHLLNASNVDPRVCPMESYESISHPS